MSLTKTAGRDTITRVDKMNHMFALIDEICIIKERIQPTSCGHLNTTVSVLGERVNELRLELSKNDKD
jgi:hypothetical protein